MPGDLRREALAPDFEGRQAVAAGAANQIEVAPDHVGRALDRLAGGEIRLVRLDVPGRAGAVILAEGVDARRLVEALPIGMERAAIEGAEIAGADHFRIKPSK